MPVTVPVAYKGLELMPTWFVILVALLAAVGIVLASRRGR